MRVAPPGTPPICAGWPGWCVRPRRSRSSSKSTCARSPSRRNGDNAWSASCTRRVKGWRLYPMVEAIQALRGVELTGAVILMTELGDITRFDNPRQLMSYLGLTPSEYSSGERRHQGGITKAGNSHARRALVEGAWAYRYPAKVSRHLQLRLEKLPAEVQAISWKAQVRRCKRYRQLSARGKHVCATSGSARTVRATTRLSVVTAAATALPPGVVITMAQIRGLPNAPDNPLRLSNAKPRSGSSGS